MAKFQCCVCGFLFIFYHIPEDYSVDNYSIWCIRKIFYLHLSIPRAQANIVQHTYLIVVSITEIIEYYKNGYLLATVGTRLHLASGWSDDHSELSTVTCESSESALQTDNHFYNIPPTSVYQTIICLLYVKSLRNLKKLFN